MSKLVTLPKPYLKELLNKPKPVTVTKTGCSQPTITTQTSKVFKATVTSQHGHLVLKKATTFSGYKLQDKYNYAGFPISVENKKGSYRSWTDNDGNNGKTLMKYDYGYIRGTEGRDKDHVDVFVGPNEDCKKVFIVHQVEPNSGKYDEDKVMLGFLDAKSAKQAYLDHYDDPRFFGSMSTMSIEKFKDRVFRTKDSQRKSLKATLFNELRPDLLLKAKYIRRIPKAGGGYKYIYKETGKKDDMKLKENKKTRDQVDTHGDREEKINLIKNDFKDSGINIDVDRAEEVLDSISEFSSIDMYPYIREASIKTEEEYTSRSGSMFDSDKYKRFKDDANNIEKYIEIAPKYPDKIYRGIKFYKKDIKDIFNKNDIINMRGISSWSDSKYFAEEWAGRDTEYDENEEDEPPWTQIIFDVQNKSGVAVDGLSGSDGEGEVIVPSTSKYKIKSIKDDSDEFHKIYYVSLEEISNIQKAKAYQVGEISEKTGKRKVAPGKWENVGDKKEPKKKPSKETGKKPDKKKDATKRTKLDLLKDSIKTTMKSLLETFSDYYSGESGAQEAASGAQEVGTKLDPEKKKRQELKKIERRKKKQEKQSKKEGAK